MKFTALTEKVCRPRRTFARSGDAQGLAGAESMLHTNVAVGSLEANEKLTRTLRLFVLRFFGALVICVSGTVSGCAPEP